MTTHKYPTVLPPQQQETIHDIVDSLRRYLEQREISHQEKQRQIDQLSASLNAERTAHAATRAALLAAVAEAERANARADAAERRLTLADAASGVDDN